MDILDGVCNELPEINAEAMTTIPFLHHDDGLSPRTVGRLNSAI